MTIKNIIACEIYLCNNFTRKSIKKGTLKSYSLLEFFVLIMKQLNDRTGLEMSKH